MAKYVYLLIGDELERDLAFAEAIALSDGRACGSKLVEADNLVEIERTGYVACGLELVTSGADVAEACERLAALGLTSEGFGIEVKRVPAGLPVLRHDVGGAFGLVIRGRPNLGDPAERFLVFVTPGRVWFGRRIESGEPDWRRFVAKPHDFSSALPARAARGICNLLVRGGERVVDPCCGSGSLLLHAAALGARVTGFDINKKMVGSTNLNLVHFGFERCAAVADAAEVSGEYDLVLTNIPYGNMSPITDEKAARLIANVVRLAPRGLIVAARDISREIGSSDARVTQAIPVGKFSVGRLIHLFDRRS